MGTWALEVGVLLMVESVPNPCRFIFWLHFLWSSTTENVSFFKNSSKRTTKVFTNQILMSFTSVSYVYESRMEIAKRLPEAIAFRVRPGVSTTPME